ncbi:PQQ-dependent dehydrogenase, methanol/ethanol family [Pseudomonas sp. N040]|nr:PQQ-dependent dehydrogenase, methanol/ethanol family [Pseudomonas sp. N040]MBW7012977.1 PQQ-dependent dehydrogenase, methanol/ethanol family [Pseudomonas sp. N040]
MKTLVHDLHSSPPASRAAVKQCGVCGQSVSALLAKVLTLGALLGAAALASAAALPVDTQRLLNADQEPGSWMTSGRTYGEQRFSPLTQISDKNVDQLGLAWQFKYDLDRVVEATPVVVDGVLYTTGAYSMVYALDAVTGKLLWKYDPQVFRGMQNQGCCDAANRGVALWKGKVYVGVYDGRLEALDARTGKKLWSVDTVIDHERNYTITGVPRIVKDKVIIGNGGAELGVRGYITAYDAETGKQQWRFFTVPGDPAKGDESDTISMIRKTWFGDQYWVQGGGGTVWNGMAYDPELDLLYIGVGNGSYWNYGLRSEGKGDNLFLSSIVAVKPDTGEYVWHYQTTPGDSWDYTATQDIIVATLPIAGKPRKVVMQAPKNGFFYVIDAATGQFISAGQFGSIVTWAKGIDQKTGRPIFDYEAADYWSKGETKTVFPGSQGAHNWQPMSFNPQTGLVYIPQHTTAEEFSPLKTAGKPVKGKYSLGVDIPALPEDKAGRDKLVKLFTGKLQAWDPVQQKEIWSVPYPMMNNGGTLTTAGNLVFQGTAFGELFAYAADTGKRLWQQQVSSAVIAGPITYEINGEQYVAFNVGLGGAFPIAFGLVAENSPVVPDSRLFVFKLGGKEPMPEVRRRIMTPPNPPPQTASAEDVQAGRKLYGENCSVCHGLSAYSANAIPDLRYLTAEKHEQFQNIVHGARAHLGMPPFGGRLKPEEFEKIRAYLIKRAHDLQNDLTSAAKQP